MTGLVGTAADAAAAALAYYGGGMGGQTPVLLVIIQLVLVVGVYVWIALALTAVFRKTGQATWKAWVPVVNAWTLFTLAGMRGWWAAVLAGAGLVAGIASIVVAGVFAGAALGAADAGDTGAAGASVVAAVLVPALIWGVYGVFALILQIRMMLAVNRGFGLGVGHTVLGILLFPVWASIVGWGSARWLGLTQKDDQPNLTAPPAPPAPSPFTLGAPSDALGGAPSHAFGGGTPSHVPVPAAAVASLPAHGGVGASAPTPAAPAGPAPAVVVPPPPPAVGGNPWAPPPPPAPAPVMRAAAPPAAPLPSAAPAMPAAPPVAAPVAADVVVATPAPAMAPATPAAASAPVGDADDLDERTVLAARRLGGWSLRLPGGATVELTADAAVLGRNPAAPPEHPGAQQIAVDDATRTVSKTHALLRRNGAGWTVTDLASTNGVFLSDESEVAGTADVSGVFFLGDARLELHTDA